MLKIYNDFYYSENAHTQNLLWSIFIVLRFYSDSSFIQLDFKIDQMYEMCF